MKKLCKDCKHFTNYLPYVIHACGLTYGEEPVLGSPRQCASERTLGKCGPEGILFEAKQTPPKIVRWWRRG